MSKVASKELMKLNDRQSLVEILDEENTPVEWVVCSNYDPKRRYGEQWGWARHFYAPLDACNYIAEHVSR